MGSSSEWVIFLFFLEKYDKIKKIKLIYEKMNTFKNKNLAWNHNEIKQNIIWNHLKWYTNELMWKIDSQKKYYEIWDKVVIPRSNWTKSVAKIIEINNKIVKVAFSENQKNYTKNVWISEIYLYEEKNTLKEKEVLQKIQNLESISWIIKPRWTHRTSINWLINIINSKIIGSNAERWIQFWWWLWTCYWEITLIMKDWIEKKYTTPPDELNWKVAKWHKNINYYFHWANVWQASWDEYSQKHFDFHKNMFNNSKNPHTDVPYLSIWWQINPNNNLKNQVSINEVEWVMIPKHLLKEENMKLIIDRLKQQNIDVIIPDTDENILDYTWSSLVWIFDRVRWDFDGMLTDELLKKYPGFKLYDAVKKHAIENKFIQDEKHFDIYLNEYYNRTPLSRWDFVWGQYQNYMNSKNFDIEQKAYASYLYLKQEKNIKSWNEYYAKNWIVLWEKFENNLENKLEKPDDFINFYKNHKKFWIFLKEAFEADSWVYQNFTIEEHTKIWLDIFLSQFAWNWKYGNILKIEDFAKILTLHDIWKPQSIKNWWKYLQKEFNIHAFSQVFDDEKLLKLWQKLIWNDYFWELLKNYSSLRETELISYWNEIKTQIKNDAKQLWIQVHDYYDLLKIFYICDAGTYTTWVNNLDFPQLNHIFKWQKWNIWFSKETLDIFKNVWLY